MTKKTPRIRPDYRESMVWSRDETAHELGISGRMLDKITKAKLIEVCRVGALLRYRREAVQAYLAAHATPAGVAASE